MEIAPLALACSSACLSAANAWFLQRQSAALKNLETRSTISVDEIHKFIGEKDEVVGHVYGLYTLATELDQLLTSVLSPTYAAAADFVTTLHAARVFAAYETGPRWVDSPLARPAPLRTLYRSAHPDVHAFVHTLVRLLGWVELKKTNRTAIHAFHMGPLHTALEDASQFLHAATDARLRVTLLAQKRIGRLSLDAAYDRSEALEATMGAWCAVVPAVPPYAWRAVARADDTADAPSNDRALEALRLDPTGAGDHHRMFEAVVALAEDDPPSTALHYRFAADAGEAAGAARPPAPEASASAPVSSPSTKPDALMFTQLTQAPTPVPGPRVAHGVAADPFARLVYADYHAPTPAALDAFDAEVAAASTPSPLAWNAALAPLYVGAHALFGGLQLAKERFLSAGQGPTYPAYTEVIVAAFVRACWRRQRRWALRHAPRLHTLAARTNRTPSPVDAAVRARFVHRVASRACRAERKRAKALVANAGLYTPTQLVARLTAVYAPVLFRCTVADAYGEVAEWQARVRALVRETDALIRADIRFREGLMDNVSAHVGG